MPGIQIQALTDLGALLSIAQLGADEHGVALADGGLHAGEWETSMLESIHPELVHPDRAEPGYTDDPQAALSTIFDQGVHAVSGNGVIGNPATASAEHGARYWDKALAMALDALERP